MSKQVVDHDIRVWVTGEQYLALRGVARDDERSISAYVRKLIRDDLDRVSALAAREDRDDPGTQRDG